MTQKSKQNHLTLVEATELKKSVEYVVDQLRFVYTDFNGVNYARAFKTDLKSFDEMQKKTWIMCCKRCTSSSVLTTFQRLLDGDTKFNDVPPTPMAFAKMCEFLDGLCERMDKFDF